MVQSICTYRKLLYLSLDTISQYFVNSILLNISPKRSRWSESDIDTYSFDLDNFKKEVFKVISEGISEYYSVRQENFTGQNYGHPSIEILPKPEELPVQVQELSRKVKGLNSTEHLLRKKCHCTPNSCRGCLSDGDFHVVGRGDGP